MVRSSLLVTLSNPKSEVRNPKEIRSPKPEVVSQAQGFAFRISTFHRISDFGFRFSASWHAPNDVRSLLQQLAEGAGQPGGEEQQRPQRQAHRRHVASGDRFANRFSRARTDQ